MSTYRRRPSKPVAILGALAGAVILAIGFVTIGTGGNGGWFIWLWLGVGVAIVAFNLWAAFAERGNIQTIATDGEPAPAASGPSQRLVSSLPDRRMNDGRVAARLGVLHKAAFILVGALAFCAAMFSVIAGTTWIPFSVAIASPNAC